MSNDNVAADDVSHFFERKTPVAPPPKHTRKELGTKITPGKKAILATMAPQGKHRRTGMSHQKGPQDKGEVARTVFVGNLPNTIDKKDVLKAFAKCGEIVSVRLRSIRLAPEGGKHRGRAVRVLRGEKLADEKASCNAFVVFATVEAATTATQTMPGTVVKGHHISVTGESPQDKAFEPRLSLFLGNLSPDVSDEEIWTCFLQNDMPGIRRVRVVRDPETGKSKGIAYVGFRSPSDVTTGLKLRGAEIGGRPVRICHVMKTKDPNVKGMTRRQKRALDQANAAGPTPALVTTSEKPKPLEKTSERRELVQANGDAWWMGTVTNPRKKLARDLRPLTTNDAERRRALRKAKKMGQGPTGGAQKKGGAKKGAAPAAKKPSGKK